MSDKVQLEGINSKGYGIVYQVVMLDPELSLTAKAIYAYYASYSGAGEGVFPSRETVLKDLNLSKNGYYTHYKQLIENGYIVVKNLKGYRNRNLYVLVSNPKKIKPIEVSGSSSGTLSLTSQAKHGFGFIPKLIMTDRRLSAKAKGVIAYLYSLVGAGYTAFPRRSTILLHLGINKDSLAKYLSELKALDYLNVTQRTAKNGKFSVNDYYLNENPGNKAPCPKIEDISENGITKPILPCPKKEDISKTPCPKKGDNTQKPCPKNEDVTCPKKEDNNNSNRINSNISYTSSSKLNVSSNKDVLTVEEEDFICTHGIDLSRTEKSYIANAIKLLCRADEFPELHKLTPEEKTSLTMMHILTELATSENVIHLKEQNVTAGDICRQINFCLLDDTDGLSLRDFMHELSHHYRAILSRQHIKRPSAYARAVIVDLLHSFPLEDFSLDA